MQSCQPQNCANKKESSNVEIKDANGKQNKLSI